MNHATHETAARLKEAGFPQPEPEFGQVWYCGKSKVVISCGTYLGEGHGDKFFAFDEFGESYFLGEDEMAFAPTATDILRELGEAYNLTICGPFSRCEQMKADEYFVVAYWQDENPAEAGAPAWLAIHEKKE